MPKIPVFRSSTIVLPLLAGLLVSSTAQADVMISSAATQDMSCTAGVCSPTTASAVLNIGDLEAMLASGNVEVTTTGSGIQADNIVVGDGLTWSASSALTLDAYQSVSIDKAIAVQGQGGLTLTTDDGGKNGTLAFGHKGSVTFTNLSTSLVINGTTYTLVNTIKSLASAIANNPSGSYALASSYDASQDGTYTTVPIPTTFTGVFEGLNNAISNLSINDTSDESVGLFADIGAGGTLSDLATLHSNIISGPAATGVLVGENEGAIANIAVSGLVSDSSGSAGGLAGYNVGGSILFSRADVSVTGLDAGGLVGFNTANSTLAQSYATGKVFGTGDVGGLVDENNSSTIINCYSTGRATTANSGFVGGFVGGNAGSIENSYSTGKVKGGDNHRSRGGFVGGDLGLDLSDTYWDIDTSRITNKNWGAGNIKQDSGIEGLSTQQLQSGLPEGFDSSIWGQKISINSGLPYLLANPPR